MRLVGYLDRHWRKSDPIPIEMVRETGIIVDDYVYNVVIHAMRFKLISHEASGRTRAEQLWYALRNGNLKALEDALRAAPIEDRLQFFRRRVDEIPFVYPFHMPSFRDFYAFEAHVVNARKKRGLEMVPEWYDAPVFYFSNTAGIVGDGVPVKKPAETNELDYELEWGVVIGKEGGDISVEDADDHILGFTIINDWSMRDVQRHEMKVGLGPAKGKDFATSVGPWLVTPDELEDRVVDRTRGKRYDLAMEVFVNGERRGGGNTREMRWTFAELIAVASRNTTLKPGDLIGSGTVGTGCLTEFPDNTFPWLAPGDTVTMTVERLGRLENTISLA